MIRYAVLCLGFLISVHASLDEKGRERLVKRFGKCFDEFNLTPDEFVKIRGPNMDPCFAACYFKQIQIMNDKGMLDVEHANTSGTDEDGGLIQMLKAYPEACKDVNEKEVSDGEKGCERAKMIVECAREAGRNMHLARKQNKD